MAALPIDRLRRLQPGISQPQPQRRFANFSVMLRYLLAVPFLATGAALMTVGALLAGTTAPRTAGGRGRARATGSVLSANHRNRA